MSKSLEKIAIVGLGYVGLPLAIGFSKKYQVVGFDINKDYVDMGNMLVRDGFPGTKPKKKLQKVNFLDRK